LERIEAEKEELKVLEEKVRKVSKDLSDYVCITSFRYHDPANAGKEDSGTNLGLEI